MDNTRDQHPRSMVISSSQKEIKDEGSITTDSTNTVGDALSALSEVANVNASFSDFPSVFRQCNGFFDSNKSADSDDQQSHGGKRGRAPEHPCWEIMQRIPQDNCMICRLCSKQIMWINTRNAMQHLKSCNQQIADELERVWQSKLQLRADLNRFSEDSFHFDRGKRRGRTTEHPSWFHFNRIDKKGANCKLCGVRVAYACSGNLMKHLKSRHVPEFVIAQKEWDEILLSRNSFIYCVFLFSKEIGQFINFDRGKRRGRTTEHPSWFHFNRIDKKGANCKLCGVRVAYACSGNLMKHLKSRHVPEFVIAQKEWDEILRKKKQLCEIRLMAASGESGNNSPQDFPLYDVDDDDELIGSPLSRSASREGDIETRMFL
uniref:BED-type domain-containing protein n=1 Tax=Ascaris lumbricoides TaxID=6252 RepID=A0A0M3IUZ7_ASCLU